MLINFQFFIQKGKSVECYNFYLDIQYELSYTFPIKKQVLITLRGHRGEVQLRHLTY